MRPTFVFALAGALGGWALGFAQTASTPSSTPFTASVTVTATLVEEPADGVPATVDVFAAAAIERLQADEVLDLLRTLPGVAIAQNGSPGKQASVFLRGTSSAHVLVLWNGIELNDPNSGGFDWGLFSTLGAERVEVVRGAASAIYGSDALGGVVQLVTARSAARTLGAAVEAGSHDLLHATATGGATVGRGRFDLGLSARRGDGELANDGYDADEAFAAVDFAPSESWSVGAVARALTSETGLPFDFFGSASPSRAQSFDGVNAALPVSWTGRSLSADGQLAWSESELALVDPHDPFAASLAETERAAARLVVRHQWSEHLRVDLGGDWDRARATTSSAFGAGLADEEQATTAAFAQASYARDRFRLDLGARFDDNDAFGSETSARVGAAWSIDDAWRLRGSFAQGFRAPSLADLYYPGFGNPELVAETSDAFEVAAELARGPVRASLVVFEHRLRNLIVFDFATFLPQNVGRARARGVELASTVRFDRGGASAHATYLDSEDLATGEPLLRRPEWTFGASVDTRLADLDLALTALWVDRRLDFGGVDLDAYTRVDLRLAWRGLSRWTPFARVENLLDESYEEIAGSPAPGRTFAAGLRLAL